MISVNQAEKLITKCKRDYGTETVPLLKAMGRILREDIKADRDYPPFDQVRMDGIAIKFTSWKKGNRRYKVEDVQAAGSKKLNLKNEDACLEVMTGANLPGNTDTVLPYEQVEIIENNAQQVAVIKTETCKKGQHIQQRRTYNQKGDLLQPKGVQISAAEITIAASVGKSRLLVSKTPRIAIISTGDELVAIDEKPEQHQIRRSNMHMLQSLLHDISIDSDLYHFDDDFDTLYYKIASLLKQYDIIMSSGGVSRGKFDFLPDIFSKVGVTNIFHGVSQKPGKPFWFGDKKKGPVVFALPGNPVSSMLCYLRYVRPWLLQTFKSSNTAMLYGELNNEIRFTADKTCFKMVKISISSRGTIIAEPLQNRGSGDFARLAGADGFIELPAHKNKFQPGEVFTVHLFRNSVI